MISAGSKAPANSLSHRTFWSLKQKQNHMQTVKLFLPFHLPFHGKGATELWLVTRKVLLKQNQYQLPSESDAACKDINKTKPHFRAIAASRGPYGGAVRAEIKLVSSAVPVLQGLPVAPAWGIQLANTLAPSPRACFSERPTHHSSRRKAFVLLSLGKTDLDAGGAKKAWPGLI